MKWKKCSCDGYIQGLRLKISRLAKTGTFTETLINVHCPCKNKRNQKKLKCNISTSKKRLRPPFFFMDLLYDHQLPTYGSPFPPVKKKKGLSRNYEIGLQTEHVQVQL